MVLRFVMGIIVGLNSTVVPLYLREISAISITGFVVNMKFKLFIIHIYLIKLGIMYQGTTNLGTLVGYFLGLGFPIE